MTHILKGLKEALEGNFNLQEAAVALNKDNKGDMVVDGHSVTFYTDTSFRDYRGTFVPELVWTCHMEEPTLGIKVTGDALSLEGCKKDAIEKMQERLKVPTQTLPKEIADTSKLFVSHCSSDKSKVDALEHQLTQRGVSLWYDSKAIIPGLPLYSQIRKGLKDSRAGILYISPEFVKGRVWTERELRALIEMQEDENSPLFIVVDGLTHEQLKAYDPMLSSIVYLRASDGLDVVASKIVEALQALESNARQVPVIPSK